MIRRIFTIAAIAAAAITASAEIPVAGTAVHVGSISVGEPIVGTSENVGGYHLTSGHVQGVLEVEMSGAEYIGIDSNSISVYPNPVDAVLNIDRTGEPTQATLTLYAINGSVSLRRQLSEPHETVDASAISTGIYILTIDNGSKTIFTTKIIKH